MINLPDSTYIPLVTGIFLICYGIGLYKRLLPIWGPFSNDVGWWRFLVKWRVVSERDRPQDMAVVIEDIRRCFCSICSSALIGAGVSVILLIISVVILLPMTKGVIYNYTSDITAFSIEEFFCMLVGFDIGVAIGVWRVRRAAKLRVTYADLHQRQLTDYRSVVLRWIAVVPIVCAIGITLIAAPQLGSKLTAGFAGTVQLPTNIWTLSALPTVMVVIMLIVELLQSRIATGSRLMITANPVAALQADNILRANMIGVLQSFGFMIIGYLGMAQCNLLINTFWAIHFWQFDNRPLHSIMDTVVMLFIIFQTGSVLLISFGGRLGGSITGWSAKRSLYS